jgi:hypothetical protein
MFFTVNDKKDLYTVIEHFMDYPLQSYKWIDFTLFCQIFKLVQNKNHLSKEGFNYIVSIRKHIKHPSTLRVVSRRLWLSPILFLLLYQLGLL